MSQEIATRDLQGQIEYARVLSGSAMLPQQYRGKPENLLYAVSYAESLGVHPLTAVTGIHVIEGKPTASAQLISALVRRAGHKLRVTSNDREATAVIIRSDDPDFEYTCTWTLDRAKAAGLTGKKVWSQYPAAMMKARAITEVARDACAEALHGVIYTAEELGSDQLDADGEPTVSAPVTATVDYLAQAKATTDIDEVRAIWEKARDGFAPTDQLDAIKAYGISLAESTETQDDTDTDTDDVVEAEIVEEV